MMIRRIAYASRSHSRFPLPYFGHGHGALYSTAAKPSKVNRKDYSDMAWEAIVGAVDAARRSGQQIAEPEHLMKSLLEQKHRLATMARLDNTSSAKQQLKAFKDQKKYGELGRYNNHDLTRRTRNNPVIIGEPGVGKTAIVKGLAQRIAFGDVPEPLKNLKLISLDMGLLLPDAGDQGDFRDQLKAVLKEVIASNGHIVFFVNEIHTLVDLLKGMIGRGELQCIGTTTLNEHRKHIENDPALENTFQQVVCDQPSVEDTISILRGLRERYELYHRVKISDAALVSAAILADRYITERCLPDKAIDLVDESAANLKIEITYKPTELDEVDGLVLQLEMEKLSLKNDTGEATEKKLAKLERGLESLKEKKKS